MLHNEFPAALMTSYRFTLLEPYKLIIRNYFNVSYIVYIKLHWRHRVILKTTASGRLFTREKKKSSSETPNALKHWTFCEGLTRGDHLVINLTRTAVWRRKLGLGLSAIHPSVIYLRGSQTRRNPHTRISWLNFESGRHAMKIESTHAWPRLTTKLKGISRIDGMHEQLIFHVFFLY